MLATRLPLLLVVGVLAAAPPALSQENTSPVKEGARAFVFGINPTAGLLSLDGGTLGVKWHTSEARATRLGLTVDGSFTFTDGTTEDVFGTDRSESESDGTSIGLSVGGDVLFLQYARSRTPVYLYYGVGPAGSLALSADDRERNDVGLPRSSSTSFVRFGAGVAGVIGVEWPVSSALSLTGEYGLSLQGTYERRRREDRQELDSGTRRITDTANTYGLELGSRGARAGVSVYF